MLTLYILMGMMLACAIGLLSVPFVIQKNLVSVRFVSLIVVVTLLSLSLYQLSGNKVAVAKWLTTGRQHFLLLNQFDQLGGVEGAISKIEEKLKDTPSDAQGWFILGKLYLAKKEEEKGARAINKAHELAPDEPVIKQLWLSLKS
jgi:cytochrome c-type biogenesis protein CcmH/NrfG